MIELENIPGELRARQQWLNWKTVARGGRPTKVPFQPSGETASSTDCKTWHAIDECHRAEAKFSGIGFVFKKDGGYIGIDLDGCRNPTTGVIDEWAQEIVARMNTYTEVSPSGTGVKLFGFTTDTWLHSNKSELPGNGYGDKKPGIEVYQHGRYFAVTGKRIANYVDIRQVDDGLEWLAATHMKPTSSPVASLAHIAFDTPLNERASKYLSKMDASIEGQRGHDAAFKASCVLVKGFALTADEAYSLLLNEFNPRCQPPWSERELRHKIDSALKQPGSSGFLKDAKPDQWQKIKLPNSYREHPMAESITKTNIRQTTLQAAVAANIARLSSGRKSLIETGIPELDYSIGGGLDMGEMMVIAARPSHGKSAVALQMVHRMTRDGIPVAIISEEMSADALAKRTIQFGSHEPEEHWYRMIAELKHDMDRHFEDRAEATILESCGSVDRVIDEVKILIETKGVKVVFVDYLQLLRGPGNGRYEMVTNVSSALRQLASQEGIVVVALAQLNREIEKREKAVPSMRDLRDSGQIEQDADVIVFGVWPHRINSTMPPKEYQFFVSKNRNRSINKPMLQVEFNPSRQKFEMPQSEYAGDFP